MIRVSEPGTEATEEAATLPRRSVPTDHMRHPSAMECLAGMLERSGGYKVLRRVDLALTPLPEQAQHRIALFVDVETTGLEPGTDEVIQLAAVPFSYDGEGNVVAVHEPLNQLRDPGRPIPAEVSRLTGIDDEMVRGKEIDLATVDRLLSSAALVVAHNAQFDRAFLERLIPGFAAMPWACSIADVPWREEDVFSAKLELLALRAGIFYGAHDALADCLAAVEILRRPLPRSGRVAMAALLDSARRGTVRVAATKAPFDRKGLLKARGYRWRPRPDGGETAWVIETSADRLEEEVAFLRAEVYGMPVDPQVTRVTAYDRYSTRV